MLSLNIRGALRNGRPGEQTTLKLEQRAADMTSGVSATRLTRFASCGAVLMLLALLAGTARAGTATNVGNAGLVLSTRDIGTHYVLNKSFTARRTLPEITTGAPITVKRQLAATWLDGVQIGFNGDASVAHQAVISTADLFRNTHVATIMHWWEARYIALGRGSRLAIPASAPGRSRFLLQGRMQGNQVLIYLWRHGTAVLSAWLIGSPGVPRLSRLMELARLQDRRATAKLGPA